MSHESADLSNPYPETCRLLLEFIKTGDVKTTPNPAAEQLVAARLETHAHLMADPVAREVIEKYWRVGPPASRPRSWLDVRRVR